MRAKTTLRRWKEFRRPTQAPMGSSVAYLATPFRHTTRLLTYLHIALYNLIITIYLQTLRRPLPCQTVTHSQVLLRTFHSHLWVRRNARCRSLSLHRIFQEAFMEMMVDLIIQRTLTPATLKGQTYYRVMTNREARMPRSPSKEKPAFKSLLRRAASRPSLIRRLFKR